MRTYSQRHWIEAQRLWAAGEFSHEWREVRHQAAMRGMIYPPAGSKWDSWEDDEPSQRAIVIRAIRETPDLLKRIVAKSDNWSQVVERLMRELNDHRADLNYTDRDIEAERGERISHQEAVMTLSQILKRIGDSA